MDISIYADVLEMAPDEEAKKKVTLILEEVFPGEKVDIPDPYNGILSNFDQVYEMLDEACENIANKLIEKHSIK
jgi:protein-tyrosine phosphatase